MTERKTPPPLPGAKSSGQTPPPLPEVGLQSRAAVPPPLPISEKDFDTNSPVVAPQSEDMLSENPNSHSATAPSELPSAPRISVESGLGGGAVNEVKRISSASKLLWLFVGIVGLGAIGGLGAYAFSKKDIGNLSQIAKAPSASEMPLGAGPSPLGENKVSPQPIAAPEAATNASGKDDRIREQESQLAQMEADNRKLEQTAAKEQANQQQNLSAPSSSSGLVGINTAGIKPESRAKGEQCMTNSDCMGELRCETGRCTPRIALAGGVFKPESRRSGETCNSNSDCAGSLKCESGFCSASASKMQPVQPSTPNNVVHLIGTYFVFKGSVKDVGNGYRTLNIVSNSDVLPGQPYAGQVKSQVGRYVMNCQSGQWGYDQVYFHAMPFGEGQRIATYEWQPNQVAFNPIQGAQDYVRKTFEVACHK